MFWLLLYTMTVLWFCWYTPLPLGLAALRVWVYISAKFLSAVVQLLIIHKNLVYTVYLWSNLKQLSCVRPPKMLLWKKMWNPKWWPRNGRDGRLNAKILIMKIQVNLCCLLHISQFWIVVTKIFAFSVPSQPFLGYRFGFHIFLNQMLIWFTEIVLRKVCVCMFVCLYVRMHICMYIFCLSAPTWAKL